MEQQKGSMTRRQTEKYIESLGAYGSVLGLANMRRLCEGLELKLDCLKVIHIAGTNGKGSTLAFVSQILKEAGYRVGRYLSPTIFEYRERFQIGGRMITYKDLCGYMTRMRSVCGQIVAAGYPHPTLFEIETAMAFYYFYEKECDFIVLETGLGGALDATNVIPSPLVSVLASISMDHMAVLGNTLGEITAQKCGIIKDGCPVVSQMQPDEALAVIRQSCQDKQAPLTLVEPNRIRNVRYGISSQTFSYRSYDKIKIRLAGMYQIENAALALEVVMQLLRLGYEIPQRAVYEGFWNARWQGRFSVIAKRPLFVVDGAHNEDAAARLAGSIRFYFTNKKIIYIMGVLKDKEYDKIIRQTYALANEIIAVKPPDNPRSLDAYELAKQISLYHNRVTMADSLAEAVEMAYLLADPDSVIVAFGSLSYLGELIRVVTRR